MDLKAKVNFRRWLQGALWPLVLIVTIGGLKYPILGFFAPAVMIAGMIGGIKKGRYVCGWLCPRGAFFDRVLVRLSRNKNIPDWIRNYSFRWIVFILLMGLLVLQISKNPGSLNHWGAVFVRICIITTSVAVLLGIIFHPRMWCAFCPMGTFQSSVGGRKVPLYMEEGCRKCRTCEKSCPIGLKIVDNFVDGKLNSKDCLKCPECQLVCPKGILKFK